MRMVELGATGLRVSALAYSVYGRRGPYEGLTRKEVIELIREAWRLGINFYVTAPVYGNEALELLGEALGDDLDDAVVAVLVGYKESGEQSFEPDFLHDEVERSCDLIGKCPVDLVLLHDPPLEVLRLPQVYEAARALVEDELASHIGVSIARGPDALAAARAALRRGEVEALRVIYNMLEQEPGATIIREAKERGRGVIAAMPHAGGLLLGETPRDWERLDPYYAGGKRMRGWYRSALALYEFMKEELRSELEEVLEEASPAQLAIRFIFSTAPVDAVEVAARSREKLRELVEAVEQPALPEALLAGLRRTYQARVGAGTA